MPWTLPNKHPLADADTCVYQNTNLDTNGWTNTNTIQYAAYYQDTSGYQDPVSDHDPYPH
jgi:hypothetical protein